uniref:Secreted protein n=1 Tax=Leersia perrieri TaxID=77586 RepID=A0A0D9VVV4_9ORYZ
MCSSSLLASIFTCLASTVTSNWRGGQQRRYQQSAIHRRHRHLSIIEATPHRNYAIVIRFSQPLNAIAPDEISLGEDDVCTQPQERFSNFFSLSHQC